MRRARQALIVVALAVSIAGCASSQKAKVVAAYSSAQTALEQFQQAEIKLYELKQVPALTEEKHKDIHGLLSQAFDAQIKVGDAIQIWQTGHPAPQSVHAWMAEAGRVVAGIRKMFPGDERVRLVQLMLPWIEAIINTVKLLGAQPSASLTAAQSGGGL